MRFRIGRLSISEQSFIYGTELMHQKFWATALLLTAVASTVQANCIEENEEPIFRQLKQHLLVGDYDEFFETSKTQALSDELIHQTKVQLVQYLGVPRTCVTVSNRRHSESFETSLVAFIGEDGQHLYTYFAALSVDGVPELVWSQISTDFSEMLDFLR